MFEDDGAVMVFWQALTPIPTEGMCCTNIFVIYWTFCVWVKIDAFIILDKKLFLAFQIAFHMLNRS